MTAAALYGLAASALLVGAVAALAWRRLPPAAALGLAALAAVPAVGGESLALWVHGVLGPPSMSLTLLALLRCLGNPMPALGAAPRGVFLLGAAAFYGVFLGGFAGGDFYGAGYRPAALLLLVVLPAAAWLHHRRHQGWLLILAIDLAAYAGGLFDNAWNALFDPLLVVLALVGNWRQPQSL